MSRLHLGIQQSRKSADQVIEITKLLHPATQKMGMISIQSSMQYSTFNLLDGILHRAAAQHDCNPSETRAP